LDVGPVYIDGRWQTTGRALDVTDKYTGQLMARVAACGPAEVEAACTAAKRSLAESPLTPWQRYEILSRTSAALLARREEFARTIAREAGKPLKDAVAEVSRAANTFRLSAEEATRIHGEMVPLGSAGTERRFAYTVQVPVGVVCAIRGGPASGTWAGSSSTIPPPTGRTRCPTAG